MNEKTDFSLGIPVSPNSGFNPLPDLVAFDLCKAYPMPDGNLLLHNTRNDKRAVIMPAVYASLLICDQFQTLDQHVANIIENNPDLQGEQADIRNVLQSMLEGGMMLSAKNLCDSLKRNPNTSTEKKQTDEPVVAIITWERPEMLERLLESMLTNCKTEKFKRLFVIDDSRKAENITQNQALVEKFASAFKVPLQYFGLEEQQSLINGLVKRLPEHENSINFLTDQSRWPDQWTCGRIRNLALLVSCGFRLVVLDDDTICDVFNPPQAKLNITFSDEPREAGFFTSEQDWTHQHQPINPDPINRHMQCLGLSFSEALNVLGQNHLKPAGLVNATALQLSQLQADSPVLITECGSLGCPGTSSNTWLPYMEPGSLKQMLASQEKTTLALNNRKVWSGRNQPHFAPRSNMSQITGLDNRQMLPPYIPITRGQDRVFGYTVNFIFPSAVTLDYPWAIPHLPMPDRKWSNKDLDFTPTTAFPTYFFEKMLEPKSSCQSESPIDRLSTLSAWFNDLAAAPINLLRASYRDARLRNSSEKLQLLSTLLSKADSAPVDWQNYLRNGISQLNADLDLVSREDFISERMENEELIIFWKDFWADFAAALTAWPEIRKAAAEIVGN